MAPAKVAKLKAAPVEKIGPVEVTEEKIPHTPITEHITPLEQPPLSLHEQFLAFV